MAKSQEKAFQELQQNQQSLLKEYTAKFEKKIDDYRLQSQISIKEIDEHVNFL